MNMIYTVARVASDGARWTGVAEVVGQKIVERGAWVMADGKRVEGTMEMVWGILRNQGTEEPGTKGEGELQGIGGNFLKVVTAFGVHEYLLVEADGGWVGQYECGDDMYYVMSEPMAEKGWKMRFEVAGPKKDGWQDVVYERQLGA